MVRKIVKISTPTKGNEKNNTKHKKKKNLSKKKKKNPGHFGE